MNPSVSRQVIFMACGARGADIGAAHGVRGKTAHFSSPIVKVSPASSFLSWIMLSSSSGSAAGSIPFARTRCADAEEPKNALPSVNSFNVATALAVTVRWRTSGGVDAGTDFDLSRYHADGAGKNVQLARQIMCESPIENL